MKAPGAKVWCWAAALFLALPAANAPAGGERVQQVLILDSQAGNPYDEIRAALAAALAGYGYVEGRNLRSSLRVIGNDVASGESILREELQRQRYDVVYAGGTAATIAARNVLYGQAQQAVVFAAATDPVGIGVIKDFASKPPANFTGISYPVPVKSRLRFLRQLLPQARSIGIIYADMPQSRSYNAWLQQLVDSDPEFRDLKLEFRPVSLVTGENGDRLMAEAARRHVQALDAGVDVFLKPNDQMGTRRYFSEMVYKTASKPLLGMVRDDVMAHWGATGVIYPAHGAIGRQAARMIRDLLQGAEVAAIAPEWPGEYGFAVDLVKARKFGLSVPVEILQMAGDNIVK